MTKTNLLNFNISSQESKIMYEDTVLSCSSDASFLGWRLDFHLSWSDHVDHLAKKLSRFAYALRVLSSAAGVEAATCAYYAYVHSLLKYGVMFWGRSVNFERIFKLQKSCIRSIFKLGHIESCRQHFKSNRILTVSGIYIFECAVFVKSNYTELFKKYEISHRHGTRAMSDNFLLPPATHLTKMQKTMLYQCIKVYNSLTTELKALPLHKFKQKLKHALIENVLYDF